ncbi:MAG: CPBP family glutamic-type intramembrane protease, partial [Candidatus Nanopelagicales bacterium]
FRGFMVHAGFKAIGAHAVPLMSIFYCFIHIGKPLPEVVASLVGGLVLGYLSLRLQSIAVGVAFHLTMAWGVDAAVLLHGL